MNIADSDFISGCFFDAGYKKCTKAEDADIVVVNTCTVRQHAEDRALGYLGEIKWLKKKNKKIQLYVVGCVAARLKDTLKKRFPFIDKIIPAGNIEKFSEIVKELSNEGRGTRNKREKRSEFVTISRGCSNYCSYCIVPYVRGEEISRPVCEIFSDIENLIAAGHREIVLLGQNVNSYRSTTEVDFADLLVKVNENPEIKKIGFMTSHPKDMSDKIIDALAGCKKVSHCIHLPLQSGSDRILNLMNRYYTRKHYAGLIKKIRSKIPDASFTTDIIVGFPTETEKDFQDTLDTVKEIKFSGAFTFKYSPRENTKAYSIPDDVPMTVKERRLTDLNTLIKNVKTPELLNY